MTVSNEDRRLAKNAVDEVLNEWYEENGVGVSTRIVLNATIVNALVSHGWGPRPRLTNEQLTRIVDGFSHACRHCPTDAPEWVVLRDQVWDLLRECGIEVTDEA